MTDDAERAAGTGFRWRRAGDRLVVLELEVAFDQWREVTAMGLPTLAAVMSAAARLAARMEGERAPERGGGAVLGE
jgi:hypothetical protein